MRKAELFQGFFFFGNFNISGKLAGFLVRLEQLIDDADEKDDRYDDTENVNVFAAIVKDVAELGDHEGDDIGKAALIAPMAAKHGAQSRLNTRNE